MKQTFLLIFAFTTLTASSQQIPAFGKIDKADLEYKECSYDQSAAAEYLIDYGEVMYYFLNGLFINEATYRIRIKVLKEKGIELANIRLPYYSTSNKQNISKIEGYTFNLDETGMVITTKLEKKAILSQKLMENVDMEVFTMPNVKVGTVFEYRYRFEKKNSSSLEDWIFQRNYPVRHSEFNVQIPTQFDFTYQVKRTLPMEESTEDFQKVKRFVMKNIPSLDREPYMGSAKDYLQRVNFQLRSYYGITVTTTWPMLTARMLEDEDFGKQLNKNILKNLPLNETLKEIPGKFDKAMAIYDYVRKNISWNGDNSIWAFSGVKNTLEKKTGNSADLNILMLNLLKEIELDAYPLLVSTRSHGKVNPIYPFYNQFDNVYAYVEIDKVPYVFDATNKYNPAFLMPWDIQFTDGYIVDKKMSQFIFIGDVIHRYKINTSLVGEIDEKGELKGSANVLAFEYAKVPRLGTLNKGKGKYLEEYFSTKHPEFTFDSLEVFNIEKDSLPLENKVKFKGQLNSSGEYFFFSPNFLLELEKNPFIAEQRFSDVEFGHGSYYNIYASLKFPETLEVEDLPKNIKMISPDTSMILQRFMQKNDNTISLRINLEFKRATYYADEYPDFKAFYTKLFEMLGEQIVFRKKTTPKP